MYFSDNPSDRYYERMMVGIDKDDEIEILATDEGILLRIPNIEVRRLTTVTGGNQ